MIDDTTPATMNRRGALARIGAPVAAASALHLLPGTALAASADVPAGGSHEAMLDSTPQDRLRSFMMMRGALDDQLVIYYLQGQYFGLVDGETTPLCGLLSATVSRYRKAADGGYVGARGEISLLTDLVTGEVIHALRNPYTGETAEAPARGYPPSAVKINPELQIHINESSGEKLDNTIGPIFRNGDDVWVSEVNAARTQLPGGKVSLYNEVINYRAHAADFVRPDAMRVPCDMSFTSTVSWRSWMKMGDRPGQMLAVGAGTYVSAMDQIPGAWLDEMERTGALIVRDPIAFLDPVWAGLG